MRKLVFTLALLTFACVSAPVVATTTPEPTPVPTRVPIMRPFPQHVTYAPNSILPNHRTREQLDDDVRAYYDYWKANYVAEAGTNTDGFTMYRVVLGKDEPTRSTTVSEGQGYGMVIVPIMAGYDPDAQTIFDGMWAFVDEHRSEIDLRLMDWNVPLEEGNASAFDGDADIAFGLLLADAQWGSDGRVNYKAEAETMIAGILESTIGPESHLPMLGDWVNVGEPQYNQFTPRSSDFMLVNFRAFRNATNDPVWEDVIFQSQTLMANIQEQYSPQTGLMPDFIVNSVPAPANFLENVTDGAYNYNAGRVPWRVGADALLNDDSLSRFLVQNISHWVEASAEGDPLKIRSGYELTGEPLPDSDYFTTFFVAPMGVAAMNDPAQQEWLNKIYDSVYNNHIDYYEDSIDLLCMMVMSGNFWSP
ncbi:MAG: beta-glucanase [Chloroflexi bacterium]|nr:beta-glucanase [Chloroflexota bacterium]MBI3167280.1 beta-glucanase [Chloroflexota bacterium]